MPATPKCPKCSFSLPSTKLAKCPFCKATLPKMVEPPRPAPPPPPKPKPVPPPAPAPSSSSDDMLVVSDGPAPSSGILKAVKRELARELFGTSDISLLDDQPGGGDEVDPDVPTHDDS